MAIRIPPSSSTQHTSPASTGVGDKNSSSTATQNVASAASSDATSGNQNQMKEALNSYLQNVIFQKMQKDTNKATQAQKKNQAKQKEHKAEEEE